MWLFGRMDDLMSTQGACLTETFPADLTDEGSRPGMDRHVPGQIVVGVEDFPTLQARESLVGLYRSFLHFTYTVAITFLVVFAG